MQKLIILISILTVIIGAIEFLRHILSDNACVGARSYLYKRKPFFLSRAEHEFYDALILAVGNDYYVFAQVHLPTILEHKIKGQNWRAAFSHINRKSLDFVLCDKAYIAPKLAIELDDSSHERPDRKDRDGEVERILKDAGMPLLRIDNHGHFNPNDLAQKIKLTLSDKAI